MRRRGRAARAALPAAPLPAPPLRVATLLVAVLVAAMLLVAAPSCGGAGTPAVATSIPANGVVTRLTDGDTVRIRIDGTEEKVRLIGIDTPESVKPGSPVECFGKEASEHTAELLPVGTPVRVVLDAEPRDRYGRLLAYVYRATDGELVNLAIARDGYAGQLTIAPNVAHTDEFRRAVADARAAGRGLWSACRDDLPV